MMFQLARIATENYMDALGKALGFEPGKSRNKLIKASKVRGDAGTWLHPKMAVAFARWLDVDFAVWCDMQIDSILRGTDDKKKARHISAESHKPSEFLSNKGVDAFVSALDSRMESKAGIPALDNAENPAFSDVQNCTSVHSSKGGKNPGTYAVELVAIRYAAWINPDFEVDVYLTFQAAVKQGNDKAIARNDTRQSNIVENAIIQATRSDLGKETTAVHYMSEAKMVNFVALGDFIGYDRDTLTAPQLALLSYIEVQNGVMYARGVAYTDRKARLLEMAEAWKARKALKAAPKQVLI